ncbi:MAG: ABC transporter substrate-binding protein [Caldilineaceae bacterium]|nr:ABC transporter substrate-binding protein [Caldilineaceae bacterium]
MAQKRRLLSKFTFLSTLLAALVLILAACGGGPPRSAAPDAPAAAPAAGGEAAAPAAAAPAAGPALDEYQTQREACTKESPCWPEIVDTIPTAFSEAPMLAALVESGDLPPVEERLPSDPLVVEPAEMIGEYGGVLRGAFTGPGDRQNYERWINDYTIFWDAGATELRPRLATSWESNEDASVWTITLREGLKWSDGEPFTADDYIFWREHIVANDELVPAKPWWIIWGGELAEFAKVDDHTFTITFADPFPTWPVNLASSTVAGHLQGGRTGGGLYAPAHYLEQFHPDFIGEEEATAMAKEAGFETWNLFFLAMNDAAMNPDAPVMAPWKPTTILASDELIFERNPYFWAVDTEGNQLPYFDGISLELVEELEVLNLRAIAGNYTIQGRHIDFSKLPVIRENQAQGDYFVDFWLSGTRHPVKIAFNMDWNEDPDTAEYTVDSVEFRRALSLAIERDEINETFFLGVGTPASMCPADTPPYYNSDRWDEQWGQFDPDQANQILDEIGLDQKDAEGYRLLPNGKRLTLRLDAVSGAFLDYPSIGERIAQMWAENVGVYMTINPVERSLWIERTEANQPMMSIFETGEFNPEALPRLLPTERWAPVAQVWGNDPNPDPAEYDGPQWIKDLVLKHWEATKEPDPAKRRQLFIEGSEILCDYQPRLGVVVDVPVYTTIIKNNVRNVPKPFEWVVYAQTPGNGLPEQMFEIQE